MTIISRTVAIWDIDTTIADNTHRANLLQKFCKDCGEECHDHQHRPVCTSCGGTKFAIPQECWDKFLAPELLVKDVPVPDAQRVIEHMRRVNMDLHFITGRNDKIREATEWWLTQHMGWIRGSREKLYMRDNIRSGVPASVMKEKLLKLCMDENKLNPRLDNFLFFEDDTHVFTMYSKYGLVIRCPEGLKDWCPPGDDVKDEPAWKR